MIIHQIIFNIKLIFLFVEHVQDQFDMTERTFRHTIWRTNYQLWKIWRKNKFWPRQSNISQEGFHNGMGGKPIELPGPLADNSTPVLKGSIPPGVESKTQ